MFLKLNAKHILFFFSQRLFRTLLSLFWNVLIQVSLQTITIEVICLIILKYAEVKRTKAYIQEEKYNDDLEESLKI